MLTTDDAWRIAANVAQLPALLGAGELERSPDHPTLLPIAGRVVDLRRLAKHVGRRRWHRAQRACGCRRCEVNRVHREILSNSRSQTFTCCQRSPRYLNSSSRGFSRVR